MDRNLDRFKYFRGVIRNMRVIRVMKVIRVIRVIKVIKAGIVSYMSLG